MEELLKFYATTGPERVGVILKSGEIIEAENIHPNPDEGFDVSAEVLVKYDGEIVGAFHTHPSSTSNLSADDYQGFLNWPDLLHFIIGSDGVRCFRVRDGVVFNESNPDPARASSEALSD